MSFEVRDLGRMSYEPCAELQKRILEQVIDCGRNTLLLVEHHPVLTLGASFHQENLLLPVEEYVRRGIQVVRTDRGGDVTYHGPGQLVIYPIFHVGRDLHQWMRDLEETMLQTLASFGLQGRRFAPHTGAWIGDKKVAAIGVKIRKWVSMHGIALNCLNDLGNFELIIPCGIQNHGVTSLSAELGTEVTPDIVKPRVIKAFREVFPDG